jgi:TatD DNase family protein
MGCYFPVNAGMLRFPRDREILSTPSSERLLTETDGPFRLIENRYARPMDTPFVVRELAALRSTTSGILAE